MASYATPQEQGFFPYTQPWYPARELLAPSDDLDAIVAEFKEHFPKLELTEIERRAGISRMELSGEPDMEAGILVDAIRALRGGSRTPSVSPVHAVMVGQPNVVGNPQNALPNSATNAHPRREGDEGRGVTVAIIDTGIQQHPWLGSDYDARPTDYEAQVMVRYGSRDVLGPQAGHCVFLAGLVLIHAPAAKVIVRRTADSFGRSDIVDVAAAIDWAVRRGADVINLSLGCFTRNGQEPWVFQHVLSRVPDRVAVVASAGNAATESKFWPGAFDRVTSVGALASNGGWKLADYTNHGPWVNVFVHATDVLSTYIQYTGPAVYADGARLLDKFVDYRTGWATWSGTSMASAIWAGAIARAMTTLERDAVRAAKALEDPGAVDFVRKVPLVSEHAYDGANKERAAFEVVPPAGPVATNGYMTA
jgi:hypothetical protein